MGCCHTPSLVKGGGLRKKGDAVALALAIMIMVVALGWCVFNWKFTLGGG